MKEIKELRAELQREHESRAAAEKRLGAQSEALAMNMEAMFQELSGALHILNGVVQEVRHHTHVTHELLVARQARDQPAQRTSMVAHQPVPVPPQPGTSTVSGFNNILSNVVTSEGISQVEVEMYPMVIEEQLHTPPHHDGSHMEA